MFEKLQIGINKMLSHINIVKYYGHRRDGSREFIFLEFVTGGELFDKIGKSSQQSILFEILNLITFIKSLILE